MIDIFAKDLKLKEKIVAMDRSSVLHLKWLFTIVGNNNLKHLILSNGLGLEDIEIKDFLFRKLNFSKKKR